MTIKSISHEIFTATREVSTPPAMLGPGRLNETYDLQIAVPEAANPIEEITRLVSIDDSTEVNSDDYISGVRSERDDHPDGLNWQCPLSVTDCCPTQVHLDWEPREGDRDAEREIEAQVAVKVAYSSLEPVDDGAFTVRVSP